MRLYKKIELCSLGVLWRRYANDISVNKTGNSK
jgi:hypothetical protein